MKSLSLFTLKRTAVLLAFTGLIQFSGIGQTSKKCSCDTIFHSLPAGAEDSILRWVSKGLSQKFLCTALAAPASRSDLYVRLITAKSIYNQRIIVKDYKHIPGLNHEPFQANNLSAVAVLASVYGISDPRYDLPSYRTSTFTDTAFLTFIPSGTVLYRVTDAGGEAGGFWTLEPPKKLKSVIGGTAVMPEWNGFSKVVSYTVPTAGLYAWKGKAAAQPISQVAEFQSPEYELAGLGTQLFINDFLRDATFKAAIEDVTSEFKKW